jgi:hypothetical protein
MTSFGSAQSAVTIRPPFYYSLWLHSTSLKFKEHRWIDLEGADLDLRLDYPDWYFSWFFSAHQTLRKYLKIGYGHFLAPLYNSIPIWLHVTYADDESFNVAKKKHRTTATANCDKVKMDEMLGHGEDVTWEHNFGWKTWSKEITWETYV